MKSNGWKEAHADGRTDVRTDVRTDGQTDRRDARMSVKVQGAGTSGGVRKKNEVQAKCKIQVRGRDR